MKAVLLLLTPMFIDASRRPQMDDKNRSNGEASKAGDLTLAERAYQAACRKLILERRRLGETIVLWRDGRVQHVPASEIPLPEEGK
jgi:hypothetical protein